MSNDKINNLLEEVLESISVIIKRTDQLTSAEDFLLDDKSLEKLDAVSMRLQVIGETLRKIENENPEFLENYKEVEWNKIIRMRDLISHHYFDLDSEIIFDVIKNHLPNLKTVVQRIITDLNKEN